MKRTGPPKRRTPLRPGGPLPRENRARKKRLYAEQFGEEAALIRKMPCCICRRRPTKQRPGTSSHVKGRGAGGKKDQQVPMCGPCHMYYEDHKTEWNERYGLPALAARLAALFAQMSPESREAA